MEFIIAQGKRKRVLKGPFNICASREDLQHLKKAIDKKLEDESDYGWLRVDCYPFWTTDHNATQGQPDTWEES